MNLTIKQNLVPSNKYNIKCPHAMNPTRIVIHNTANDASAQNEIAFMIRNNDQVSYHFAVDDKEVVQGLPLDRNGWHSGDGANGKGNREGIAIEICYSKSGGDRFTKAEQNGAKLTAQLLKERGWGIDKVTKHQDYANKYCPHRTLDMGWQRFINMVQAELGNAPTHQPQQPQQPSGGYTGDSLVDYLKSIGVDSSFTNRQHLAQQHGIANYTGTASQNTQLLNAMRGGSAPQQVQQPSAQHYPAFNSNSIIDGLKSINVASDFNNRNNIAIANGITNYSGTASQNTHLLSLARQGELIRA
jgi:N-acetylmuramoyl-L-alanine amidase CwlA